MPAVTTRKDPYAEVLLNLPARPLDRPFHYCVPEELDQDAVPGVRVKVPFSGRTVEGIVLRRMNSAEVDSVKPLIDVLDKETLISPQLMSLAMWMAEYYLCTRAEALRCVLPTGVRWENDEIIELIRDAAKGPQWDQIRHSSPAMMRVLRILLKESPISRKKLERMMKSGSLASILRQLESEQWIVRTDKAHEGVKPKSQRFALLTNTGKEAASSGLLRRRAPRQSQVLELLVSHGGSLSETTIRTHLGITGDLFKRLEDKGYITRQDEEIQRDPYAGYNFEKSQDLCLNQEQDLALRQIEQRIQSGESHSFLLHGVTGSGKTEVYLQAIRFARSLDLQAIVLVPEIALTPQTVERFKSRFGEEVAVLHSRLSAGERYDQWRRIRSGEASVVVGARSALFAPFTRLGLIIIDEEHETSYKQSENPKYHARDTAWMRCRLENAVLVLGSATPSLETYYKAEQGQITKLTLPERVTGETLPKVTIVDMREELKAGNRNPFSRVLQERIRATLAEGRQSIIFLNRRGFSTFVLCRECGLVLRCPHCDVSLTYHAGSRQLVCHYCQYTQACPDLCPQCKSHHIRYFGIGTERVEEEAKKLFPDLRVLRMDMDTTGRKGDHERILAQFRSHKADMLVGTQMIAKGLDFENVTLVGVITADTALNFPDYVSAERTFQLMTQVAGRAGRGEYPGDVVIQTYAPDHYSIELSKNHDYNGFYTEEMQYRSQLRYPPLSKVVSVLIWGPNEKAVIATAEQMARLIESAIPSAEEFHLMGPVPALMSRIKKNYRWQMHLLGYGGIHPAEIFRDHLQEMYQMAKQAGTHVSLDVDPIGMA